MKSIIKRIIHSQLSGFVVIVLSSTLCITCSDQEAETGSSIFDDIRDSPNSGKSPSFQFSDESDESENDERRMLDGYYCAEVSYYYEKTGWKNTYTLEVEIRSNRLSAIYWPNEGWLDESHFTSPEFYNGVAEFTTDEEVDYTVRVLGARGSYATDYSNVKSARRLIRDYEEQLRENYELEESYDYETTMPEQINSEDIE
jgi:hypothetical protein